MFLKNKRGYKPIRSEKSKEMLGPKEWEQQMFNLARGHQNVKWMKYNGIVSQYNHEAYKNLNCIRTSISKVSSDIIALIPSARWLFDNFQMMYREIKKVKTIGAKDQTLPILKSGEYRGYPRIYVLARKMVDFSGGYITEENIFIMIKAYQRALPLTDKELWILPEMIGLCILESIIEVSRDILENINTKSKADEFVKEMLASKQEYLDVTPLLRKIEGNLTENVSFHCHVIYTLKSMSVDEESIQKYIAFHYQEDAKYINASEIFKEEGKLESLLESKIRTLIVSLRETNQTDEEKLFEGLSNLEQILVRDPDGVYPVMDSDSRGYYREIIEELAEKHNLYEGDVGEACILLAQNGNDRLHCSNHIGTYIIGKGYPLLKAKVLNKPKGEIIEHKHNLKGMVYFILSAFLLMGFYTLFFQLNKLGGPGKIYWSILLLVAVAPILIGIALEISNNIITRIIKAQKIPALDYIKTIPDTARTFIVMPVIISSKEQGLEYLDRLQKYYLANRQPNLFYGLLLDYADSTWEFLPEDNATKEALIRRIDELNENYPSSYKIFSLFIRDRHWNKSEACYMGWERKRGKLEEFNALLNGEKIENTSFSTIVSDKEILNTFVYVITLDADSNLIINNAAKLVGLIDHPLNHAIMDPKTRKIKEGYVIIQPSVRNHIIDKKSAIFPKLFVGQTGIKNYATLVSDIYQDIFDEGTYVGKGIYNVHMFYQLLNKTIPDNSVLSHDLLEGSYARTAFDSTVNIMDNFPGSILSYGKREHRWIRGDWQLLPWLFKKKGLDKIARFKILDNLRHSLLPISKLLLILMNLAFLPTLFYIWIPFVLFSEILYMLILLGGIIIYRVRRPHLVLLQKNLFDELLCILERALLEIVFTPYKAFIAADAIMRTLYRVLISKKKLLKWKSSEVVEKSITDTKKIYFINMWSSVIPSIIIGCLLFSVKAPVGAVILYSALALVWIFSFLIAYAISQPSKKNSLKEPEDFENILQEAGWKTWSFFRDFSKIENNWLCPDNYQLAYKEKVTVKTSPTNIGLQLLSTLSARDLGYETLGSSVEIIDKLIITIEKLPKWKGHLYNWYQIQTLEVLNPQYISTVDSGNFYGDLIALNNGLKEQKKIPLLNPDCIKQIKNLLTENKIEVNLKEFHNSFQELYDELVEFEGFFRIRDKKSWEKEEDIEELVRIARLIIREIQDFDLAESLLPIQITMFELASLGNAHAFSVMEKIDSISLQIQNLLANVDFKFLYDEKRMLFHIGYHVSSQTLDAGCYDLIASESALTSFIAIARGEIPVKHWYKLGRPLTIINGIPAFVSWSGTMFEYLMPGLVMKSYEKSVFSETFKAAVQKQIKYAKDMDIPWGISESQYYCFDLDSNYQYRAFGVDGLKLQPSLSKSMVVTPYATMLALEYESEEALFNLSRLKGMGALGKYGYYEAIDFNGPDPINLQPYCIVKSFMAHHQGMSLVAIDNYMNNGIMRTRFHSEPMIKATEVLLEEKRQTYFVSISKKGYTISMGKLDTPEDDTLSIRCITGVAPRIPAVNYLSNNNYSMMLTSDGDGFSIYKGMMLYRFRADVYANTGHFIYIKDMTDRKVWSTSYHPTKKEPDKYQAVFSPHQTEFKRRDGDITTHTTITLSPDHNLEIRKVELTNHSEQAKEIEVTSYMEIVADIYAAEISHPAFNKLFIESEFIQEHSIFLSRRRSNTENKNPYIMHMVKPEKETMKKMEYENDRLKFIGRNNTVENPDAIMESVSLSNNTGFSNDPIMSLRVNILLEPEEITNITFITGVCSSKEEAIKVSDELSVSYRVNDIFDKFRQQSEMELKYLNISRQQLNAFQDIISPIFYPCAYYRGPVENIRRNWKNQSFLWRFGVSGDCPIMLLQVSSIEEAGIIKNVLKAYEYLRINQVKVDLIILSEAKFGYTQELTDLLNEMISSLKIYDEDSARPSLFILNSYQMSPAETDLLFTVARVVFSEKTGIYFRNIKEIQKQVKKNKMM